MSEAIFGLIGVLLGAIAAGVGDYLLGKRRERVETKRAARLLLLELKEAREFIEDSLQKMRWVSNPEAVLSNEVWVEHRAAFAQINSSVVWETVSDAFLQIGNLRRRNRGAKPGTRLEPGDERTEDAVAVMPPLDIAISWLEDFTGAR